MKKLSIIYFLYVFFLSISSIYAQLRPGTFIQYSDMVSTNDLVEEYPEYFTTINWTKSEIISTYSLPITYNDPNIGRNIENLTTKLKENLVQYMTMAVMRLPITMVFTVDDYFYRNPFVRYQLLSSLEGLEVKNSVIKNSEIQGKLILPLYGKGSISEPFYKNIHQVMMTNYLNRELTTETYYDTLIIDMVMFKNFKPSLMLQILDGKGKVVHSVSTVNTDILQKQSAVHYVTTMTDALNHPSRGKKVVYILPAKVVGNIGMDIILFDTDVERIFSQQRTLDQLKKGNVIIIHPQASGDTNAVSL